MSRGLRGATAESLSRTVSNDQTISIDRYFPDIYCLCNWFTGLLTRNKWKTTVRRSTHHHNSNTNDLGQSFWKWKIGQGHYHHPDFHSSSVLLSSITSHSFIKEGIATASDRGENRVSYDTSCACWCWCARGSLVILRELFDAGLKHPFPVVSAVSQQLRPGAFDVFLQTESEQFLSRVSILLLTRDIDIVILSVRLSVCLSVRPSVRDTLVLYENGLTYRHSFSTVR